MIPLMLISCKERGEGSADQQAMQPSVASLKVTGKKVEYESFTHYIQLNGSVEAEYEANISPEINGQIKTIHVREGQWVKKGQLLISLNTDVTESSLREIEANLELAEKTFQKQQNLWDQEIGSELQYLQAKTNYESLKSRLATTQVQIDMARITAPFDGYVEEIMGEKGEMASPGMPLLHLVDLNQLMVETEVPENYLQKVSVGAPARISFPSLPGMEYQVPVSRLGKYLNSDSRTFDMEIKFNNRQGKILPNMLALVEIMDFQTDSALIVPSIIVRKDIKGEFLFVIEEKNGETLARKKYLEAGNAFEDKMLINTGIVNGDEVIIDGFNLVSDGMKVQLEK